jgi:CBS domain containing-hemolysin-like protein
MSGRVLAGILLAAATSAGADDGSVVFSLQEFLWRLGAFALIIAINAFFVMAEFTIVKVRASQLQEQARRGTGSAKLALKITSNLERYLSATQLGITVMSIACGTVGEPLVAMVMYPLLHHWGVDNETMVRAVSLMVSFIAVTFPVVVLGEQVPKRMSLRHTVRVCLWVARPLEIVYRLLRPFTVLLNLATTLVLRLVFRVKSGSESSDAASGEEIRHIVSESERSQQVTATEKDILVAALQLNERHIRDIMTPRNQLVYLNVDDPFDRIVSHAIDHEHTRYPLVQSHLDHPLGLVHIKDLLRVLASGSKNVREAEKPLIVVPEMFPVDKLLNRFRTEKAHFALVIDEFGGTAGAVTFDDILEEVVGDIQDEFDDERPEYEVQKDGALLVDGTLNLYEVNQLLDLELDSDEVSTIGGYVTEKLGHMPKVGERVIVGELQAEVVAASARRVLKVRIWPAKSVEEE